MSRAYVKNFSVIIMMVIRFQIYHFLKDSIDHSVCILIVKTFVFRKFNSILIPFFLPFHLPFVSKTDVLLNFISGV